jgi:hypothetical protein
MFWNSKALLTWLTSASEASGRQIPAKRHAQSMVMFLADLASTPAFSRFQVQNGTV